jgi:hypothetical protein
MKTNYPPSEKSTKITMSDEKTIIPTPKKLTNKLEMKTKNDSIT